MKYKHIPVMLNEVIEYLNPQKGQFFVDCTLGGGGYTSTIAKIVGKKGGLISIDLDSLAIKNAEKVFEKEKIENVKIVNDNFKNLKCIVEDNDLLGKVDGVVLDLGMSSAQLDDNQRGISFLDDRPINMAFGEQDVDERRHSTKFILNKWKAQNLERIFKLYGEERFAKNIGRGIVKYRKDQDIKTTSQLVEIIKEAIPNRFQNSKIHPATKVFQALRIATNDEIGNLEKVLPQALEILKPGGRIAVVSFHSLEDRIVKRFFRDKARTCICPKEAPVCVCDHESEVKIVTKKIVLPTQEETKNNPRARSAKMRVGEKI